MPWRWLDKRRWAAPILLGVTAAMLNPLPSQAAAQIETLPAKAQSGFVEIQGVAAGAFDPAAWQQGRLNWVPEQRFPLLAPREGPARNIYAPSAVQLADNSWRIFYGAWDGVPTGNDRIYSALTRDFLNFNDRHTVIEHGAFHHVCNVNAQRIGEQEIVMMCTGLPTEPGLNKPVFFRTSDGQSWNRHKEPYPAQLSDIVRIDGYPHYPKADINGMNVLLHEDGHYRLYFSAFTDFGKVYRASGTNGTSYTLEQVALNAPLAVNDVKKFRLANGSHCYLMGLHMNTDKLWYSLSDNGLDFAPQKLLFTNRSEADRYIVAIGWVVDGDQDAPGRRLLGALYGAGAAPSLDQNRIFAQWLQKKVIITGPDGKEHTATTALGPDRQLVPLETPQPLPYTIRIMAEDGTRELARLENVKLASGQSIRITAIPDSRK